MATKTITEVFNEVAEAIQEKKKDYTPIKPANFGKEIEDLKSGGDLVKSSTLTEPHIQIHLDKLKENLPEACLNRQLTYFDDSSIYLGLSFSLTGEDSYSMCGLSLDLFNINCYYDPQYGDGLYVSTDTIRLELRGSVQGDPGHEYIGVSITGASDTTYIENVEVFEGMTVDNLFDNIIAANGSAIIDLGKITSNGNATYSFAEKINLHWYATTGESSPYCHDLFERATISDLDEVVEFYTNQEV